eukprot:TRINITY_DN5146_c0_g1_i1.p1 TRINITY_DN5146_c0_g1~~TRINITY_DN5146_c0_g1_i1.p1  ORF type:complete len:574 (-),score=63.37 TRINITY_DN5146_c0_g1_i1:152-1873(-)
MAVIRPAASWIVTVGVFACLAAGFSDTSDGPHLVTGLPGWKGPLPSRWFSGFLSVTRSDVLAPATAMKLHYVFVESEHDPVNDPLIIWYNGGPGASSLFGLLLELGPLLLNDLSLTRDHVFNRTGVPAMIRNPYSWSRNHSVLVLDNPPPVGFSFCLPAGPTGGGTSCGAWNDTRTALANADALSAFFSDHFPQMLRVPIFVVGESYAGVYVPSIVAMLVRDYPRVAAAVQGIALGDACLGTEVLCGGGSRIGPYYFLRWMNGHGQIADTTYDAILAACPLGPLRDGGTLPAACQALVAAAKAEVGGYYGYALYDECQGRHVFTSAHALASGPVSPAGHAAALSAIWGGSSAEAHVLRNSTGSLDVVHGARGVGRNLRSAERGQEGRIAAGRALGASGGLVQATGYPCPGPAMNLWLNLSATRKALHVPTDANFFSQDNGHGFTYHLTWPSSLATIRDVLLPRGLRVLAYNGDTDPGISTAITEHIWFRFAHNLTAEPAVQVGGVTGWRPWTLDGAQDVGGHVAEWPSSHLQYATVRGSGHMVPEFRPEAAMAMITAWVAGHPLPRYVPAPSA